MNGAKITLKKPIKNINTFEIAIFLHTVVYISLQLIKCLKYSIFALILTFITNNFILISWGKILISKGKLV